MTVTGIRKAAFLNHLCDEELAEATLEQVSNFLNHLCDEEPISAFSAALIIFLNHLCDEEHCGSSGR
uniref:hypothetical protein n=1 Tax=Acinetobacter radioresistens TaxID=40216 RepID=UPI001D189776|nr:hypothetical protein [Acinetobacter radioresistens]